MLLKKTDPPASDEAFDVLVELRDPGDREPVLAALEDLGAARVKELAGGFVSARMTEEQIDAIRHRAEVHLKRPSQLRPPEPRSSDP